MSPSSIWFCLVLIIACATTNLTSVSFTDKDEPSLSIVEVGSKHFIIAWYRTGSWSESEEFDVSVIWVANSTKDCKSNVTCKYETCVFNSTDICNLKPCDELEISVTGNLTSVPLTITTAPPAPNERNTTLSIANSTAIAGWRNYIESSCHNSTRLKFKTDNTEYVMEVKPNAIEYNHILNACDYGLVIFYVQTVGGSGESGFRYKNATYNETDAVPLIENMTLAPGDDHISVSWALSTDNCHRLEGYQISWDPGNTNEDEIGREDLMYTIEKLTPCQEYNVTLQSLTANYTAFSKSFSRKKATNTIMLNAPKDIAVDGSQKHSLSISWMPPAEFGPLCELKNYSVTWSSQDEVPVAVILNETSYEITDLVPCTNYAIEVKAGNDLGYSEAAITHGQTNIIVLESPTNVSVIEEQITTLTVSWIPPDPFGPLCELLNHNVIWASSDEENSEVLPANETIHNIADLVPCTHYIIKVKAGNIAGYSLEDLIEEDTKLTVLDPPSNLTADGVTASSIELKWTPELFGPLCPLLNYTLSWESIEGSNEGVSEIIGSDSTSYTISNLQACTKYKVEIISENSEGKSNPSGIEKETDAVIPGPPGITCYSATSGHEFLVNWTKPVKNNCIKSYFVNYTGEVLWSSEVLYNTDNINAMDIYLQSLTPWTNYTVCVAGDIGNNKYGDSACCSTITQEEIPGPPASLSEISSDAKSITLDWEEPQELNGVLEGYQLSWGNNVRNFTANDTTVVISNLKSRKAFNFTLQAITGAGLGDIIWIEASTEGANVVAIVLGILGGLLLVVIMIIAVMYRRKIVKISRSQVQRVRSLRKTKRNSVELPRRKTSFPENFNQTELTAEAIDRKDLRQYIVELEADSQAGLEQEFIHLRNNSPKYSTEIASAEHNRLKNRFVNILPYDHARVILPEVQGNSESDFINASYIKNHDKDIGFIASQGPKENTNADHWRMVWEFNVSSIVMLTKLLEKGRDKCSKYWPDAVEGRVKYGDVQICNLNEAKGLLYTINDLQIQRGHQKKMVKHFHFTAWPDFGVPQHEDHLLNFIRKIKSLILMPHRDSPMLVHCSAGVGRTGTFIALWNLIECVKKVPNNAQINIKRAILDMRECRPNMVQSQDQYLYLCKCIAAYMENPNYWNKLSNDDDHIYDNTAYIDEPIYENY